MWVVGVLMAVAFAGAIYVYNNVYGVLNRISSARDVRPAVVDSGPPPALLQDPFNVLVIGVDLRDNHQQTDDIRSDTLIVVHVNPLEKWVSLLSIPRDTRVTTLPAACEQGVKINGAYACGYENPDIYGRNIEPADSGAALAADTVEDYLDITINYTAQVNFDGFERLIDTIGGVTIDVPRTIMDAEYPTEDYGYMRLYIPAGLQHLDGETALRYARTRHADNDFGRAKRQQQVLQAVLDTIKRQGLHQHFEATPQILDVLADSIRTTVPLHDQDLNTLRGLAALAQDLHGDRIQQFVLTPEINPDGTSNLLTDLSSDLEWDPAYVQRVVQEFQSPPDTVAGKTAIIQVKNGTQSQDLAVQVTTDLNGQGFKTVPAVESPMKNVPNTLILDYTGHKTIATQLAHFLGVDDQYIQDTSNVNPPPDVDIVVLLGTDFNSSVDVQTSTN